MKRIGNGFKIFTSSIVFFFKNPRFIVPIFLCWAVISSMTLYLYFELNIMQMYIREAIIYILIFISISTFFIALSSLIILELLQQKETKGRTSLLVALKDVLIKDLWKTLPIIVIWSLLVSILTIIRIMILAAKAKANKSSSSNNSNFSAKNAAYVLSGNNSKTTGSDIFFELITKGVRFMVFMILPAIAWEDENSFKATKKGIRVFKNTWGEVLTGFTLTYLMGLLLGIPLSIIFAYGRSSDVVLPEYVWYGVIIYIGFVTSFSLLIEQLFTAGLYLWYVKWEKAYNQTSEDEKKPKLTDIPKPSFLDQVPDLL